MGALLDVVSALPSGDGILGLLAAYQPVEPTVLAAEVPAPPTGTDFDPDDVTNPDLNWGLLEPWRPWIIAVLVTVIVGAIIVIIIRFAGSTATVRLSRSAGDPMMNESGNRGAVGAFVALGVLFLGLIALGSLLGIFE